MHPLSKHTRAFTFIELLVTMVLVAILASIAYPAYTSVMERARKAHAKNDLTQIVTAVNAFYTDYGTYPVPSSLPAGSDCSFSWDVPPAQRPEPYNDWLLNELRACTAADTTSCSGAATLNTRQIVYISPPIVKDPNNPKSGIGTIAANASRGKFFDPWGAPYNVVIDSNYNNSVPNIYGAQSVGGAGVDPILQGVVAWSNGTDLQVGTNSNYVYKDPTTGAQSDDVISWQ
jgi:prepilin-type N-terminal cleavage/methylation domain-containing protein